MFAQRGQIAWKTNSASDISGQIRYLEFIPLKDPTNVVYICELIS